MIVVLLYSPIAIAVIIIIAIMIRLESPGNPFFVQKRIGKNGRLFNIYKFRTMINNNSTGFQLTIPNDNRLTTVGKYIRRLHLDELPQLVNVMFGEMSIIGPRPVPSELYTYYKSEIPNYDIRHLVLPGITGYAQVWQGYTYTLKDEAIKLKYDIYYIKRLSLKMDVKILWFTFFNNKIKKANSQKINLNVMSWYSSFYDHSESFTN